MNSLVKLFGSKSYCYQDQKTGCFRLYCGKGWIPFISMEEYLDHVKDWFEFGSGHEEYLVCWLKESDFIEKKFDSIISSSFMERGGYQFADDE